jgi:hypothetical protein
MRRLAEEQISTFARQKDAAMKLRDLNDAKAAAEKQAELTQTKIEDGGKGMEELDRLTASFTRQFEAAIAGPPEAS